MTGIFGDSAIGIIGGTPQYVGDNFSPIDEPFLCCAYPGRGGQHRALLALIR